MPYPIRARYSSRASGKSYRGLATGVSRNVRYTKSAGARAKLFRRGRDRVSGFYGRFSMDGERKFLDVQVGTTPVTAAGVLVRSTFNDVAQGTGEAQRIGRKLTLKSAEFRWTIESPATSGGTEVGGQTIRLVVLMDKQANGAATSWLSVFQQANIHSMRNLENSNRFTILRDKLVTLNRVSGPVPGGTTGLFPQVNRPVHLRVTLNTPIEFSGVLGSMSEIRSNNLLMLAIAEEDSTTTNVHGTCRIRYSD